MNGYSKKANNQYFEVDDLAEAMNRDFWWWVKNILSGLIVTVWGTVLFALCEATTFVIAAILMPIWYSVYILGGLFIAGCELSQLIFYHGGGVSCVVRENLEEFGINFPGIEGNNDWGDIGMSVLRFLFFPLIVFVLGIILFIRIGVSEEDYNLCGKGFDSLNQGDRYAVLLAVFTVVVLAIFFVVAFPPVAFTSTFIGIAAMFGLSSLSFPVLGVIFSIGIALVACGITGLIYGIKDCVANFMDGTFNPNSLEFRSTVTFIAVIFAVLALGLLLAFPPAGFVSFITKIAVGLGIGGLQFSTISLVLSGIIMATISFTSLVTSLIVDWLVPAENGKKVMECGDDSDDEEKNSLPSTVSAAKSKPIEFQTKVEFITKLGEIEISAENDSAVVIARRGESGNLAQYEFELPDSQKVKHICLHQNLLQSETDGDADVMLLSDADKLFYFKFDVNNFVVCDYSEDGQLPNLKISEITKVKKIKGVDKEIFAQAEKTFEYIDGDKAKIALYLDSPFTNRNNRPTQIFNIKEQDTFKVTIQQLNNAKLPTINKI